MTHKTQRLQQSNTIIWMVLGLMITAFSLPVNAMSVNEIREIIVEEALETSVPTSLALAVVKTESNFRPDFEGTDGARGLMQILPDTAESLGLDPASLWQVRPNIQAGLRILDGVLERTDGRWAEAIQVYGSNRRDVQSVKNQRYVTAVLKAERQFAEQLAAAGELEGRRREVLAGHDNWGTEPDDDQEIARIDSESMINDEYDEPEARDNDWLEEEEEVPEISIYHGHSGPDVEIIILENEAPADVQWQRPPPPVFRRDWRPPPPPRFRPRMLGKRDFRRGPPFARMRGHRPSGRRW